MLVVTLVALAVAVFWRSPSLTEVLQGATLGAGDGLPASSFVTLNDWAVPIAGSLFTQEIISRALASKTDVIARRSAIIGGSIYLVLGSIPVLLGLVAREVLPPTDSVE